MGFLMWLEQTGFGTFVRESPSILGYPTFLFFHTLGLSIVVGLSTAVAVRVLGFASRIPLEPLERFFPIMWAGFAINTISGSGLVAADASNKMVNAIFLTKMLFVVLAVGSLWLLKKKVFDDPSKYEGALPREGKILAGALLVFWLGAMIAGRLIGYSSVIIPVSGGF